MSKRHDPLQGRLFEEELVSTDLRQFDTLKGGVRLVSPESFLPDPIVPCVVNAPHYLGGEVKVSMVGKVTPHPEDGLCFFHAQSGTQEHFKTDCPCPVDSCLAAALERRGVRRYFTYNRRNSVMYWTYVEDLLTAEEHVWDNRRRRFLPRQKWASKAPVTETWEGRTRVYRWGKEVLLATPHILKTVLMEGS